MEIRDPVETPRRDSTGPKLAPVTDLLERNEWKGLQGYQHCATRVYGG